MNDQEKTLMYKTSIILGKETKMMKLNDIIDELIRLIELGDKKSKL
ncbi:hypothetical protein PH210_12105 [Paenibacillus sp. BSR1-1]|nr:hypothetical protein [Paenibacillus sp. BSR1-1]MDN3016940.1 hypothetical protein [Paenibacillus sp. BSR1-1]